jgi:ATP-dependent DNA helicase RecQ
MSSASTPDRDQHLLQLLKENFGYTSFRLEQRNVIHSILDGRDTLAIMPTGGGKSICYQIPALALDGSALIISPLISLMQDQVLNLHEQGIDACFLNSSLSAQERRQARELILSGRCKIIYVSPEGILSPALSEFFEQVKVSMIAIDEAHCVSQWGHEFRKDYTRLNELKRKFPRVPIVALTATADEKTRADISQQLELVNPNVYISSFDRPNIKYMILERHDELKQLDEFIQANHANDTGIIYCLSRDKVERVAEALVKKGYPAIPYHAGLPQKERTANQQRFSADERVIVVATIAFGMGIDRPDVRFVAHLDLPKSIESYYQETGRAGRDGKPSSAWMIYGLQDVVKLSQMLETTEAGEAYKKVARYKLDAMLGLCESADCRRKYLLGYFGQSAPDKCDYCDTCISPPETFDATIDAQKLISTIFRTGQMFGAGHIIEVLRGSQNKKVLDRGHDKLSVYGIGKDKPADHWNSVLRQLLNTGYIQIRNWEYRSLGLTPKCDEILKQGKKLFFRHQDVTVDRKKSRKETRAASASREIDMSHGRMELFGALKALRARLAKEQGVPPYVVFGDKTLHDMCTLLPRDLSELLLVNGVGQAKQEKYGEVFLKAIEEYR